MAQFQVPQFIEIEQKIIGGQFTMRQFLTLALGAGVLFLLFLALNFYVWIIFAVIIGVGIFAISFLKISGRSFGSLIKAAFFYYWNPSFYLWKSEDEYGPETKETQTAIKTITENEEPETSSNATRPTLNIGGRITIGKEPTPTKSHTPTKPTQGHKAVRETLKIGDQIQSLWEKISTSKNLIPKRENRLNIFQKERVEAGYQVMRKSTGEIEMAKRVDFT